MAVSNSSELAYGSHVSRDSTLTPYPGVRCPCCAGVVEHLPPLWTIEPCRLCRRPLTLVRMIRLPGLYQLCNVIDLVGSVYGAVTMLLVLSFTVSEMEPRTFAKGVTILLFIIGSLLLVDGVLSLKTAIDRTFQTIRYGLAARILGTGKALAGLLATALILVGLCL